MYSLLSAVISELFPAGTSGSFGKEMLKKVSFCQQEIVQRDNIKSLCAKTNDHKSKQELTVCEAVLYAVNTSEFKQSDKQKTHDNNECTADYPRSFRLLVDLIKTGLQGLLNICREVFSQSAVWHENRS